MANKLAALISALFLVTACGGGGSDAPGQPPVTTTMTTITTGNSKVVASRAADSALNSTDFGNLTSVIGLTGRTASAPLRLQQTDVQKLSGVDNILYQVPVGPETTNCLIAGSVTLSGEVANPLTLGEGDVFNVEWADCDDGIGVIIDGLLGLTVTTFDGDLTVGQLLLESTLTIDNFRVTTESDFGNVNGAIDFSIDTLAPPLTVVSSSGASLEASTSTSQDTLTDFSTTVTEDAAVSPSTYSTLSSGKLTSSRFTGMISYDTPVAFEAVGHNYPHTGELLVTGANGATLRVIALDAINVRLESDFDGDGTVDETVDTTWDELFSE